MCNVFNLFKNHLLVFMMVFPLPFNVLAQEKEEQDLPQMPQTAHPSKAIVIVVITIMLAVTFLLLLYVRFCRVSPHQLLNRNPNLQNFHGIARSRSRVSGIDKRVIETLPFFKFSSLKGSKEGLECTVCLSKFEDTEILRLLPKCKHAFHMNCIDRWLESQSTCPLCRHRVEEGDIKNLNHSLSSRFLRVPSNLTEDPNLEIFVQREPSQGESSRFNIGNGFWDVGKFKKQELLIDQESDIGGGVTKWKKPLHMINHKIVISDVVTRRRWSDLNSSDLLSLNCDMLNDMCSTRFSSLESTDSEKFQGTSNFASASNEEENSFTALNPAEKRSMSEIANVPRWVASGGDNESEERSWRVWLPIARRTVQWFAKQEGNLVELEHKPLPSNV